LTISSQAAVFAANFSRSGGELGPYQVSVPSDMENHLQRLTVLLGQRACTASCTADFSNRGLYHKFKKADLRISIKDYHRNKNLKPGCGLTIQCHRASPLNHWLIAARADSGLAIRAQAQRPSRRAFAGWPDFWRILHSNRSFVHSCMKLRLKYWALFQNVTNMSGPYYTV
jgi:hypothetical protein